MNLFKRCKAHPYFAKPVRVRWWDAWDSTGEWERLHEQSSWTDVCNEWTHDECGFFLDQDELFIYICQLLNLEGEEARNISAIPTYSIISLELFDKGAPITEAIKQHTHKEHTNDTSLLSRPNSTNP